MSWGPCHGVALEAERSGDNLGLGTEGPGWGLPGQAAWARAREQGGV